MRGWLDKLVGVYTTGIVNEVFCCRILSCPIPINFVYHILAIYFVLFRARMHLPFCHKTGKVA
jgi:hypothetical protein